MRGKDLFLLDNHTVARNPGTTGCRPCHLAAQRKECGRCRRTSISGWLHIMDLPHPGIRDSIVPLIERAFEEMRGGLGSLQEFFREGAHKDVRRDLIHEGEL